MEHEATVTIIELLKALLSKPDGTITAAYITIGGMFGVAAITAVTQLLITKYIIRSEHQRLHTKLHSDFRFQQFSMWQEVFLKTISELLTNTDPEVYPKPDRKNVVPQIQKVQLLLNLDIEAHRKVNNIINELGLAVMNWEPRSLDEVLGIHGRLLEAAREAIYLPGR